MSGSVSAQSSGIKTFHSNLFACFAAKRISISIVAAMHPSNKPFGWQILLGTKGRLRLERRKVLLRTKGRLRLERSLP